MPSPPLELEAYVDGGARGNPGPAGWGVVIRGLPDTPRRDLLGFLGHATNNVAEYTALLEALRFATEAGASALTVYSDSQLMVRQMIGRYRVKAPGLKPLFEEARSLVERLDRFRIVHVPRERNKEADGLANRAMDEGH